MLRGLLVLRLSPGVERRVRERDRESVQETGSKSTTPTRIPTLTLGPRLRRLLMVSPVTEIVWPYRISQAREYRISVCPGKIVCQGNIVWPYRIRQAGKYSMAGEYCMAIQNSPCCRIPYWAVWAYKNSLGRRIPYGWEISCCPIACMCVVTSIMHTHN